MKHRITSQRQGGFTLVEIAIVLMIVGLLIGGILRGQELIQSARVRNIIDQKSAVQTAYIGFLDRYRMLPGDLTALQSPVVGNNALASVPAAGATAGDGIVTWDSEGVVLFQNLTAAGFLSCGACMTVTANGAAAVTNSPSNVYGDFLNIGFQASTIAGGGTSWFDPANVITRMVLTTGGSVPSQILAEVDRKADDGRPGTGQLRFSVSNGQTDTLANCAPLPAGVGAVNTWANPSQSNCQGSWLF
jgi:prepilin-type N-terminal cleavage/methylation domain-containing protein